MIIRNISLKVSTTEALAIATLLNSSSDTETPGLDRLSTYLRNQIEIQSPRYFSQEYYVVPEDQTIVIRWSTKRRYDGTYAYQVLEKSQWSGGVVVAEVVGIKTRSGAKAAAIAHGLRFYNDKKEKATMTEKEKVLDFNLNYQIGTLVTVNDPVRPYEGRTESFARLKKGKAVVVVGGLAVLVGIVSRGTIGDRS